MTKQTGRCLCGAMTYEATAMPVMSVTCHCTHCQKATGSAYSTNICVPSDAFNITGDTLTTYVDQGDSGMDLRRFFCSKCGSPIYTEADAMPGLSIIKAGTLDDTNTFKPTANIFCESKMQWLKDECETTDFPKMPTE
ncbi:MAG: aldehyde-activating protein [Cycloclasticus sp.]|nr:MAG: aldehyde-activating protein [Cycloclasticus sp.]